MLIRPVYFLLGTIIGYKLKSNERVVNTVNKIKNKIDKKIEEKIDKIFDIFEKF